MLSTQRSIEGASIGNSSPSRNNNIYPNNGFIPATTPEERIAQINSVKGERDALRHQMVYIKQKVMDASLAQVAGTTPALGKIKYKNKMTFKGHSGKIYQMKSTKNGKYLASIGQDDFAIIWNSKTSHKTDALILENSFVLSVGFSPSGRLLACGGLENSCDVYIVNNDDNPLTEGTNKKSLSLKPRLPISTFKGHRGFISELGFLSESHAITASGDMSIGIWDTETSERIVEYGYGDHLGVINKVIPHPFDDKIFASTSSDKMVKIWDIRERRSQQTFSDHTGDVTCGQFFPDGNAIITTGDDGTIRLFDLRSDCQLSVVNLEKNSSAITSICFTPSGRTLVVGQEDGSCSSLDILKSSWVSQLIGHRGLISSICVAQEGRLYSSSWDSTIRSWEPTI